MGVWLPSHNRAKKAAKAGLLWLDGAPAESSRWVEGGETVVLYADVRDPPPALEIALEVVFEDEALAVVVKPPGLLTNGNAFATLERALPTNLTASRAPDALPWPRPVHRLDRPTGGLVACAKTHAAQVWLGHAFQERRVRKGYRALVQGRLEGSHEVREPVEERDAHSTVTAVRHDRSLHTGWVTTVDLHPHTGRTHQLRRHCASLGHPIVGDTLYAPEGRTLRGKGLFLQAVSLSLTDPEGVEHRWSIDEPYKFDSYRRREQRRWDRWIAEHGQWHLDAD